MSSASHLSDAAEARFWDGVQAAGRFFMGHADVQKALEQLASVLDQHGIPYAIVGAMALNEFGYQRVTSDVNVLLSPEGLAAFKAHALGRGYVEKFPGRRGVRDTVHGVDIDVVRRACSQATASRSLWCFQTRRPRRCVARGSRCYRCRRSSNSSLPPA